MDFVVKKEALQPSVFNSAVDAKIASLNQRDDIALSFQF